MPARTSRRLSLGGTFEFEDEKATTYELGMKSAIGHDGGDQRRCFFTDYKDLQTSAFDGAIGFNVGNGSAEVMGVELEGRWRVTRTSCCPGPLAWLDFEWTNYFGQCYYGLARFRPASPMPAIATTRDSTTSLRPNSPAYVSGDYHWAIGDSLRLGVTARCHLFRRTTCSH